MSRFGDVLAVIYCGLCYKVSIVGNSVILVFESAVSMPDLSIEAMDVKAEDEMLDVSYFLRISITRLYAIIPYRYFLIQRL